MVHDLVIVGGGISGTAAEMIASCYGNGLKIAMIERQPAVATVNSNTVNNSQTLHMGDIESNYGLESALKVQEQAAYTAGYLATRHLADDGTRIVIQRMLLGVGVEEAVAVRERFAKFRNRFPGLQLLGRDEIAAVEPMVMEGRAPDQPIAALYNPRGFAVDYRMLGESFRRQAANGSATIDTLLNVEVSSIAKRDDGLFVIKTGAGELAAKTVMVAAGSSSLLFAHAMGMGREYMLLPVAGGFLLAGPVLKGKVYTMQNEKIPFASVHGDPAVYNRLQTRFGPTARPVFLLERHHYGTVREFIRTGGLGASWLWNALRVAKDKDIALFLLKNLGYDLPFIGKRLFARSVRKIVPSLSSKDLRLDKGAGGIRGQLVNMTTGKMQKGVARIDGDGIIFVFAPSPGASGALGNAVEVMRKLFARIEGARLDEDGIRRDLLDPAREIGAINGAA